MLNQTTTKIFNVTIKEELTADGGVVLAEVNGVIDEQMMYALTDAVDRVVMDFLKKRGMI